MLLIPDNFRVCEKLENIFRDNWYHEKLFEDCNNIFLNCKIMKYETVTYNPPIRTYADKIENRITLELKADYYVKLLTPETWKHLK